MVGLSPRTVSVLQSVGDGISYACLVFAAIALFVIVGICGANVFCRHFAGFAFSWGEEAMLFLMILMIFAGAIAAAWQGGHMHLDMLVRRMPPMWQKASIILGAAISVVLLLTLSTASTEVVSTLYRFDQRSVALAFPMWIPQGSVVAGFVMMAVMIVLRLVVFGAQLPKTEAEMVEQSS
jgi:TRAP-type C4-dicarboxylate transport system permease small subunit